MIMLLRDCSHESLLGIVEAVDVGDIFNMSSCSHDLGDQPIKILEMNHVRRGASKGYT